MSWSTLLDYFVLHTILVFLLVSLLNRHMELDFLGSASYILCNSIFAFRSLHDRFSLICHFRNVNSAL